ncbi:accessory Sec system protein Asp2 [Roseburia hominis]
MDKIHILQIGDRDWNEVYELPEEVNLEHTRVFTELPEKPYDMCILDKAPSEEEIELLYQAVKAYTLFLTESVRMRGPAAWLCRSKRAKRIADSDMQRFLLEETRYFFSKPYGEKFSLRDVAISRDFSGTVKWHGNYSVELQGEFGDDFCQIALWRYNSPVSQGQVVDLWLEYHKEPEVELSLIVNQFVDSSVDQMLGQCEFDETQLSRMMRIEAKNGDSSLSFSLRARGKGKLQIIALHKRFSRGGCGHFLPGGKRYVSSGREELFYYFDPCNMEPPLNVYFAGYKTQESFEGYHLMKNMDCPFLLLSEPRLEGGSFYMGSRRYERRIISIIEKYMEELGFTSDQVILSGLSMGTYGALYYGCDIRPHALILGKPLASIGNVAANEKHLRPGGFATSLDVLRYVCGSLDTDAVERLNSRFWDKFDASDWGRTKFIVSYMIEDDYDSDAYNKLLSHLSSSGVQVYGKGSHGRHNDNTSAIVNWFVDQYGKVLREDFGRGIKKK